MGLINKVKYLCKNLEVKEGRGLIFKGDYFWENMVYISIISVCRHSEDMIKKLESAGLGFYVRETETHQKLGAMYSNYCYVCICKSC